MSAPDGGAADLSNDLISHYCQVEDWSVELATGIFRVGPLVRHHHQLTSDEDCGLLTLVRCYEDDDRFSVLDLFETASTEPSSFCFSTTIVKADGSRQALMCVGESSHFSDEGVGSIAGLFIFPRFAVDTVVAREERRGKRH